MRSSETVHAGSSPGALRECVCVAPAVLPQRVLIAPQRLYNITAVNPQSRRFNSQKMTLCLHWNLWKRSGRTPFKANWPKQIKAVTKN